LTLLPKIYFTAATSKAMAKRKKAKPKVFSPKLQQAQYRKAFIQKLNKVAEALGIEDFLLVVTKEELHKMCLLHLRNASPTAATPGVPSEVLYKAGKLLKDYLNSQEIVFLDEGKGPKITLADFLSAGQTIYFFLNSECFGSKSLLLKERFAEFTELFERDKAPYYKLNEIFLYISMRISTLDKGLYWLEHKVAQKDMHVVNQFNVHAFRPEQTKVVINNKARTALRVGWGYPNNGPNWKEIKSKLFEGAVTSRESLPVYVQSHALHRLSERLDAINKNNQHFHLFGSLFKPVVRKGRKGKWLIEYRYDGLKLGYLVADIVNDMVIIRTFLFITMDATPEGEKLQNTLGLTAVDKKYLSIDRISTFLHTDIIEHPDIKAHFVEAGCEDLFGFDLSAQKPEDQKAVAHFIRAFLTVEEPASAPVYQELVAENVLSQGD